ncbi:sine oculis-binding protein homolog A isoform X1 [Microplitis mediator]|uniref:sine oculis-binding protein homolog A isoform X1 n=2 Tax=Microplitis mediator TaxID=375433 RepID=UPI002554EA32|nr:sine oculis-binding protein homolog A isoform X1 [Microplitis mediator]
MNKQSSLLSGAGNIEKNKTKVNLNNCNNSTVNIKKEPSEDEIKEYAAKAMSELLGWYGYGKVDSRCTRGLNLNHFATRPRGIYQSVSRQSASDRVINYADDKGSSRSINLQSRSSKSPQSRMSRSPVNKTSSTSSKDNQGTAASPKVIENSDSASDTPDRSTSCSWCGRTGGTWEPVSASLACEGTSNSGFTNSNRFCSEACFAAGRRAAFKRARTCDWCRHVRHSVSYVDFHDGESQLQFCSDKCLNQYKMNIFCRETQAHLALHGIPSASPTSPSSGGLITPELWLRDCRSAPPSPDDEALVVDDEPSDWPSTCDKPEDESHDLPKKTNDSCLQSSDNRSSSSSINTNNPSNGKQDVEYVDDDENVEEAIRESLKDEESRRLQERIAESSKSLSSTESSHVSITPGVSLNNNNSSTIKNCRRSTSSSPESCKESPPTNCSREGTIFIKDVRKLLVRDAVKRQPSYRSRRVSGKSMWLPEPHHYHQHNYSHYPMGFNAAKGFTNPAAHKMPLQFTRRNYSGTCSPPPPTGSPSPLHPGAAKISNTQGGLLPPVTVLVPYPIPIPIPLPIPIPIPLFAKFFNSKNTDTEKTSAYTNGDSVGPQDLSRRSQSLPQVNSPSLSSEKLINLSDSSTSSSPVLSTASTGPSFFATAPKLQPTAVRNTTPRPLRKRRRLTSGSSDQDLRLKRRNKFVPV